MKKYATHFDELLQVLDSAQAAIFQLDGTILACSTGISRLYGWPKEDLPGKPRHALLRTEFPKPLAEIEAELHRDGEWKGELKHFARDGSVVWAACHWTLYREHGFPPAVIEVAHDITDLKLASEALSKSRALTQLVIDSAPILICYVGPDYRYRFVNKYYEHWFGCTLDDCMGEHISRILGEETFQKRFDLMERALHGEFIRFEDWAPYRNGMRFTRATYVPDKGPDGVVRGFVAFVEDLTEDKRIQEALRASEDELRESEGRFRNMADNAPVMIWVAGPDKFCTFFNKHWLEFTGRTLEQEVGYGWVEGVHPEDLENCAATYSAAFDTRRSFQMEQRLRRADGEYRSLVCTGVPRFTENGVFAGYVGCSVDITDLKRTLEQGLAAQKLEGLGVLAGGIAHDFNNLLGSILLDSELALTDLAPASPATDAVRRIKAVAISAAEIVRELMTYAGKDDAVLEPVDISRLVGEMLELLKVSISKHATLHTNLGQDLPAVRANAAQIRQVVLNLITNASEALPEKAAAITVTTSRARVTEDASTSYSPSLPAGEYVRLVVSDTGCGMTSEIQARIFDPFFTTKFAGRGLGLAAVQGILRRHGGAIHLDSAPGQGTRFEILLPCTDEPAASKRDLPALDSMAEPPGSKGTVLVVEDEEPLRIAVSKMLARKGFTVMQAVDGRLAVEVFAASSAEIDVVLLDMTLPGMFGHEVLARLRRVRPDVKVILTTAYSQEQAMNTVGGEPAWAFLRKPYRTTDLVKLLQDALMD